MRTLPCKIESATKFQLKREAVQARKQAAEWLRSYLQEQASGNDAPVSEAWWMRWTKRAERFERLVAASG